MLAANRPTDAMSLDHPTNIVNQTATRDDFLGGRLTIAQPARGFRAGLDTVLLGAAVGANEGTLLDLGAGVGTAALVALAHHPDLEAVLADSDPEALALAAENIAANGFAGRAEAIAVDVAAPGAARAAAGVRPDHYGAVIANPPFFTAGQGTGASTRGGAARHMGAGALGLWVKTAAASAAPGGEIIFVLPADRLASALAAFDMRFGAITVLPFAPRAGEPASRILIRGIKGSRAPLVLLATRSLHGADRAFAPEIEAILRGNALLFW
jgi:tRNA1(Val) A37 N6-methylase TrmN6